MTTDAAPERYRIALKNDGTYGKFPSESTNAVSTRVLLNEDSEVLNPNSTDNNAPIFDLRKHKGTTAFNDLGLF